MVCNVVHTFTLTKEIVEALQVIISLESGYIMEIENMNKVESLYIYNLSGSGKILSTRI